MLSGDEFYDDEVTSGLDTDHRDYGSEAWTEAELDDPVKRAEKTAKVEAAQQEAAR